MDLPVPELPRTKLEANSRFVIGRLVSVGLSCSRTLMYLMARGQIPLSDATQLDACFLIPANPKMDTISHVSSAYSDAPIGEASLAHD